MHDLTHERQHFVMKDFAVFDDARKRFLRIHDDLILRDSGRPILAQ
jgi:hypothetical protein